MDTPFDVQQQFEIMQKKRKMLMRFLLTGLALLIGVLVLLFWKRDAIQNYVTSVFGISTPVKTLLKGNTEGDTNGIGAKKAEETVFDANGDTKILNIIDQKKILDTEAGKIIKADGTAKEKLEVIKGSGIFTPKEFVFTPKEGSANVWEDEAFIKKYGKIDPKKITKADAENLIAFSKEQALGRQTQIKESKEQIKNTLAQINTAEEQVKKIHEQIVAQRSQVSGSREQVTASDDQIEIYENQIAEYQKQIVNWKIILTTCTQQINEWEFQITEFEKQIQVFSLQIEAWFKQVDSHVIQIDHFLTQINGWYAQNQIFRKQIPFYINQFIFQFNQIFFQYSQIYSQRYQIISQKNTGELNSKDLRNFIIPRIIEIKHESCITKVF